MKDYSLPSYTPMVNNWYSAEDFIKICENPDYYFSIKMLYLGMDENGEFIGKIDDVTVHFGHTSSYEEALKKWEIGCKSYFRAKKKDNYEICIIQNDRNGFNDTLIDRFNNLPYSHKIIFVHKKDNSLHDAFYMQGEDNKSYVDVMTQFENKLSIRRRYDRFDFCKWFLEIYNS